jgi:hypothetical protein
MKDVWEEVVVFLEVKVSRGEQMKMSCKTEIGPMDLASLYLVTTAELYPYWSGSRPLNDGLHILQSSPYGSQRR